MVHVSVQGHFIDRAQWLQLAEEVDRSVFYSLYVADHPGSSAAPFVARAAAAAVTHRIRLGTCVLNAGLWEPMALADRGQQEIAATEKRGQRYWQRPV